jgi:hypothetical protein
MTIATGVNKQVIYKKETTWGTIPAASSAQALRRTTSDLDLKKETYQSNEIRTDFQVADFRHGVRSVEGTLNGEISPGTYKDFFAAALRQAFQTATTTGAQTTITAATTTGTNGTFTRSAGSYLTDGFKVGDVVRWTGWTVATANNTKNMLITGLTATVMTVTTLDGTAIVAKAAGDSVTATLAGKKTWVPSTGHTDDSFSIEHWFNDLSVSEVYTGCKVSKLDVQLPATGMGTIGVSLMGKDVTTASAQYFTSPNAQTSTGVIAAVNGALYVGGTAVANVTGMTFTIDGNMTGEAVIGSNSRPDIFEGRVSVSGQITAFFQDATLRDQFLNETESSVIGVFTTGNTAASDFVVFNMPRIKAGGASRDDGDKGIVQTIPFTALLNTAGGTGVNSLATTISIQDSQA